MQIIPCKGLNKAPLNLLNCAKSIPLLNGVKIIYLIILNVLMQNLFMNFL